MAPSLPTPLLSSLTAGSSVTTRRAATALRAFSTSAPSNREIIPPESPKYITLQKPPQSEEIKRKPIKGHLPVPRQIFPPKSGDAKLAPDYVARATPLSKAEQAGLPPKNDLEAWRRSMAHSRREALSEGLKGLYERKTTAEQIQVRRSQAKAAVRKAAVEAAERDDDVLTRSTAKVKRLARLKKELRRDSLSELYIASKDFIVDEAELAKKVDELFDEGYWASKGAPDGLSIWDVYGPPIRTSQMVDQQGRTTGSSGYDIYSAEVAKTARKQKIVAEELTGGKMV
ncbi:hypothetical protein DL546_008859 [Coniochaeta pulveracea]|uniref:Uncharacterized protein n=1 Tax=Coniochaeta pulveracea TaxID=177199 RepID=A0A420YKN6_9PEZI|nr:hypothetical protein DL546_008859 [Coniochaeta pulveracea]